MNEFDFKSKSQFETPELSPGFLLWRASTLWRRSIEKALKALDLTHPQFVILATIAWLTKEGNKASQIQISKQASLDPNTTSQILRGLQKKGLIKRAHAQDERSKSPTLTPSGNRVLGEALPAVEKVDKEFFSQVNIKTTNAFEALKIFAGFPK